MVLGWIRANSRTAKLGTLKGREPRGRSPEFEFGSPKEDDGRHLIGSLKRAKARERMNHFFWKVGMGVSRKTPGAVLKRWRGTGEPNSRYGSRWNTLRSEEP